MWKFNLKFGDGDGPNLCRVKKVDASSTFIENIFRSDLEIVSVTNIKNISKSATCNRDFCLPVSV